MIHAFRLHRGQDLCNELNAYARSHSIAAAAVISGVGCLTHIRLRDASGVNIHAWEEDMEIVSLTGTVSLHGSHLHISLSRRDLSVLGGHLMPGCLVNTTAEIILLELPGLSFTREFDEETGYDELSIRALQE